jgi:16S rRNA (cytosine967-C5)-methyltransferase
LQSCEPTARAPDALRFTGTQDLFRTESFAAGEFEIQDLASQLVGIAAAPQPGETWWDACAGEGGKTLHLADQMANKGVVWSTDRNARRLDTLKRRAARAKLFNYRAEFWDGGSKLPTKTKFDGILLDAPCSGTGTWQRNPHARWTTTLDDVRELAATQRAMLENICGALKPGGRLIYSVCTLTRSETTAVANAFTAAHPELEPLALALARPDEHPTSNVEHRTSKSPAEESVGSSEFEVQRSTFERAGQPGGPNQPSGQVMLRPQELNANGMFIAAWRRKS